MIALAGFIQKEFTHIFRDVRTLIILLGMPVAQVLLFGFVITNEIKNAKIAILNLSDDDLSHRFINKIVASDYFVVEKMLTHHDQIDLVFKVGNVKEVIVIDQNFEKKILLSGKPEIQIITDASEPNNARLLQGYTFGIITGFLKEILPEVKLPVTVKPIVRMLYNPELKGAFMFVPGTMAMLLLLISAMMTSISIAREKELGTMEILLISPLKPFQIIVGKVIPYVLLSFIISLIIIILGTLVFGVPVKGNLFLLLFVNLLFIVLSLSIGFFISIVSKSQQMAMMISMFALMLPAMLLSGFIYPIENMPVILQWLSSVMPSRWFLIIIKNIMLKGGGVDLIWRELLILFSMTVFFIVLSIRKFKVRL